MPFDIWKGGFFLALVVIIGQYFFLSAPERETGEISAELKGSDMEEALVLAVDLMPKPARNMPQSRLRKIAEENYADQFFEHRGDFVIGWYRFRFRGSYVSQVERISAEEKATLERRRGAG